MKHKQLERNAFGSAEKINIKQLDYLCLVFVCRRAHRAHAYLEIKYNLSANNRKHRLNKTGNRFKWNVRRLQPKLSGIYWDVVGCNVSAHSAPVASHFKWKVVHEAQHTESHSAQQQRTE